MRVIDEKTIAVPIGAATTASTVCAAHPRSACRALFLIPGVNETLRIIGSRNDLDRTGAVRKFHHAGQGAARGTADCGRASVYFQCAKAIMRSKFWDPATKIERSKLPTAGEMLAEISDGEIDGHEHDRRRPERVKATIY